MKRIRGGRVRLLKPTGSCVVIVSPASKRGSGGGSGRLIPYSPEGIRKANSASGSDLTKKVVLPLPIRGLRDEV